MKFPKIPKPLLIVIVIIVILGVVSCGAGVFRGLSEDPSPAPGNASTEAGLGTPSPDPVPFADVTVRAATDFDDDSSCSKTDEDSDETDDHIAVEVACDVTIKGQFLPHVLRLSVANISLGGSIAVQQQIDGRMQPDPPKFEGRSVGDKVEISVTGLGQVDFRILCGSCLLRVTG